MRYLPSALLSVLALSGGFGADDPSSKVESAATETTLRIADWNIQVNGEGTDGRTDLDRTYAMLRAKAADADIITSNEGFASTISSFASRLTTDTGVHWYSVTQFDVGSHNHSGVWSRYPFASTPVVYSYSQPASMDTGPKTAGEVDVNVNGKIIHLIVTRLCSPCGGSVRAVQAQDLVAWAQGFGEPRIITGDFNDSPGASSITTMKASYIDSFRQAQAMGTDITYADKPTGPPHGCSYIDYIWLKGADLGLVDASVPDVRAAPLSNPNSAVTEKVGCSVDWSVRPSDHDMVKATLTLTAASAPSPLPAGWTAADVGAVGKAGSTSYSAGTFSI